MADFQSTEADFGSVFFLLVLQKSVADLVSTVADFDSRKYNRNVISGLDLFQIY
jgi:hypothetical protein